MRIFKKEQDLSCIYCNEEQYIKAIDTIAYVPNFSGLNPPQHQEGIEDYQCNCCDQVFFVTYSEKTQEVTAANLPSKLYLKKAMERIQNQTNNEIFKEKEKLTK